MCQPEGRLAGLGFLENRKILITQRLVNHYVEAGLTIHFPRTPDVVVLSVLVFKARLAYWAHICFDHALRIVGHRRVLGRHGRH